MILFSLFLSTHLANEPHFVYKMMSQGMISLSFFSPFFSFLSHFPLFSTYFILFLKLLLFSLLPSWYNSLPSFSTHIADEPHFIYKSQGMISLFVSPVFFFFPFPFSAKYAERKRKKGEERRLDSHFIYKMVSRYDISLFFFLFLTLFLSSPSIFPSSTTDCRLHARHRQLPLLYLSRLFFSPLPFLPPLLSPSLTFSLTPFFPFSRSLLLSLSVLLSLSI